jgi:hypothetical protein
MQPIARCGYADYAVVDKVFQMPRRLRPVKTEAAE